MSCGVIGMPVSTCSGHNVWLESCRGGLLICELVRVWVGRSGLMAYYKDTVIVDRWS